MRKKKMWALAVLVLLGIPILLPAQTGGVDEDALFGGGDGRAAADAGDADAVTDATNTALFQEVKETNLQIDEILLTDDRTVTIGGSYHFDTSADWRWDAGDPPTEAAANTGLTTDLQGRLTLNARPDANTRFYSEIWITYPFSAQSGERTFSDVFYVDELFSDFTVGSAFVRAGKQTMNWGVGYFFSPADVLNRSEIDPEDPNADQEGPAAIRVNVPVGTSNIYAYGILPDDATTPEDIAGAAMVQWLVGGTEVSTGVYGQADQAPAAMVTATGNFGDLSLFTEGMASWGSDRRFVSDDGAGMSVYTDDDTWYPQFTVGGLWNTASDDQRHSLNVTGQYYSNGEGYEDSELVNITNPSVQMLLAGDQLGRNDIMTTVRHYIAGRAAYAWDRLGSVDPGASVLAVANLSDQSGSVQPTVQINAGDSIIVSLGVPFMWGQDGTEYAPRGANWGITLTVSAGGMKF
ncbi:MAG: hypothetical protein WD492_05610 [Alkalispirochaeta sp.]